MKKYIKEILLALVLILYLVGTFWFYSKKIEFTPLTIGVVVLTILAIIFYILELKKRVKDINSGSNIEDEFSQKVKVYAGYYSFIASFFLWVILFITVNFNHMSIRGDLDGVFGVGLFGTVVIYYSAYYYLKATGNFHEK